MSWLRSAVNRVVVVGGRNNVARTVRSYADTVVHHAGQAVAGGTRIIKQRIGTSDYQSVEQVVKRLEEAAVSCRGLERVQLLQRWLIALKEIESSSRGSGYDESLPKSENDVGLENSLMADESSSAIGNASLVFFDDSDLKSGAVSFRDVFLHSQALEGITMSMILEAPSEEEVSLLLEIFRLCFTGHREAHCAIMTSIKDLAKAFSCYEDEVLVKREELLQYAQVAISGLKLNADVARIDAETSKLWGMITKSEGLRSSLIEGHEVKSEKNTHVTVEALKEALAEVRLCSKLEALLLQKKSINIGDSPDTHSQKVNKLKVLAESLANSSSKTEMRILDQRHHTEEALNFRVAKSSEVSGIEKEIVAEVAVLEKQRDELETELRKVTSSLVAVLTRLNKTREERDQFYEASNQLILHLKAKEDELTRSVASCKVETDIVHTWIHFLEDTWILQASYGELKDKQTIHELEKSGSCFMKLIKYHLLACKEELGPSINRLGAFVDNLSIFTYRSGMTSDTEIVKDPNPRKLLEEEYLEAERKVITAFSVVDHMKELFYAEQGNISRKEDPEIKEVFDAIEKLKGGFGSIKRPILEIESPIEKPTPRREKSQKTPSNAVHHKYSPISEGIESPNPTLMTEGHQSDQESGLFKLQMDTRKSTSRQSSHDEFGWEFDDLEHDLSSGD